MALLWGTTLGFILILALLGGIFIYFIRSSLDSSDINRIDPLPLVNEEDSAHEPEIHFIQNPKENEEGTTPNP